MNQKVQCLIDGGFISIKDVLDWANDYMLEQSMADSNWECGYGGLHPASMQECDCAKYEPDDEPIYEMTEEEKLFERMRMLDEMYGDDVQLPQDTWDGGQVQEP